MRKLQSQGVHHITIVGADRQTSIGFWEGVLGMPFVFEQPNLDNASESHLYFDPGDGRLITVFTNEERTPDPTRTATDQGCVHHIAFSLSQATFHQAVEQGLGRAPMSVRISPYILALIDWDKPETDPLRRQFLPLASELLADHPMATLDSLHERTHSPVPGLVHRYRDKVL